MFARLLWFAAVLFYCGIANADPLEQCRALTRQMQENAVNDGLAAHIISFSYKDEIGALQAQLATITKERDELREKLKPAESKPGG